MDVEDFKRLFAQQKEVLIFGTGFVAEMFWTALEKNGLTANVKAFVVTAPKRGQQFHGLPVYSLKDVPQNDQILCMAVHGSVLNSIYEKNPQIRKKGIWINPWLIDLLYGKPISIEDVSVKKLLKHQDIDAYWLTVRYAAVRDYLSGSTDYERSKDLYIRTIAVHCTHETAVRRSIELERLADSMASNGFSDGYPPIRVVDNLQIIDGLHRAACAAYLDLECIPAAIYAYSDIYDLQLGPNNRLPETVLQMAGLKNSELDFLRKAKAELIAKGSD